MIKKLILSTISACILAMGASAGAATVDSVVVGDTYEVFYDSFDEAFNQSIVTVEGTLTDAELETGVDVYVERVTDSRGPIADGKNYAYDVFESGGPNVIVQPTTVNKETKTFTATFKFNAPGVDDSGNAGVLYKVYASNCAEPEDFLFIKKDLVVDYVDNTLAAGIATTYEDLDRFGPMLGADVSFAANDTTKQNYLVNNLAHYKDEIANAGEAGSTERINKAKAIINRTKAELEFMAALPSTELEGDVHGLIQAYATSANINTAAYDALKPDAKKMAACKGFIGKTYTNMETFRTDWKKAVAAAAKGGEKKDNPTVDVDGNDGTAPTPVQPSGVNNSGTALFSKYNDVASAEWAVEAISYVVSKGIMQGTSQNSFEPNTPVTREQVAKIISVAFNSYNPNATSPFKDVPKGHWSASYVGAAYESGLLTGKSETEFGLGEKMTREDLCTVMYRAATKVGYNFATEKSDFVDIESVNSYAQDAVRKLAGAKIISGMGDGVLAPKGTATRAQTAQMLMKLAELIK